MEKQQGMNRREFLLVAGGAAIAVPLAAVLGGCGGGAGRPHRLLQPAISS